MAATVSMTSAAGLISLLDEPEEELKIYALKSLDAVVNQFWPEISETVSKIEVLYEDSQFKNRELAALVASKVYYHLGEFDESLQFALGAGSLFDPAARTEYVETTIAKCIDKYIELRVQQHQTGDATPIDSRLEAVVKKMFKRCYEDKEFKQVIGIAIETMRLDILEETIKLGGSKDLLPYVLEACMKIIQDIDFRNQTLRMLVKLFKELDEPDYISICQCLNYLNDFSGAAELLHDLVKRADDFHILMAYQLCFDFEENATQEFLNKLVSNLPVVPEPVAIAADAMETDTQPLSVELECIKKIRMIINGELSIKLNLEFLHRNNKTDLLILKTTKNYLEGRSTLYHSAITFSNAFMNAGTTSDEFLRQNLEWLSRASNWAKFSATAALGVIHKGQIAQGKAILSPYLPQDGVNGSAYSEGGALFALGLIHANHGAGVVSYLRNALKNTQNEVIQHGACLGLGVAGMATDDEELYDDLKTVLFGDNAVAGEAAGLAMGLVMLGTASPKAIDEMLQYSHETQHEKIIRGLALGMAMIMYGKEEKADALIEQLCTDKDPILRYGGIFMVAMAYSGTGSNKAIRRLLHVAVSDVNDDVRRASVIALGFLLFKTPKQVPRIVKRLSESYNPHVRYGATLALGIACAGTGMTEAISILEPMTKDSVDYVRQGALIAHAMILIQQNEVSSPAVVATRKLYEKIISEKHSDQMTKFGAVLGQGIIDAGGRNVTISLQSRSGSANMPSIVGMAIFTQFWYWYPLSHFLSLSFTPTSVIGLNKNLQAPKFEIAVNAKPSMFAYPPMTKPPTTEVIEKVATAVLSTTNKTKARARRNNKENGGDAMDTDDKKEDETKKTEGEEMEEAEKEEKKEKKKEPSSYTQENMSRVVPGQLKFISFKGDSRYKPVKKSVGGILLLHDEQPDQPEDIIDLSSTAPPATTPAAGTATEAVPPASGTQAAPPPAPFEYHED